MAKPVVAFLYDFDQTLSVKDQQEYSIIPSLGYTSKEFWSKCDQMAKKSNMDSILSYMLLMLQEMKAKGLATDKKAWQAYGKDIKYLPGVEGWFKRINEYGKQKGIKVEHYIISSGIKEVMESTTIAKEFKGIFGCEYYYGQDGNAMWPCQLVNYTTKTQYVFRISKGALDLHDDSVVNSYVETSSRHVPYSNMIYIGDGLTDVPCMKLVREKGGTAIALVQKGKTEKAKKLLKEHRVDFACAADYNEGKDLDLMVKKVIDKIALEEDIKKKYNYQYKKATTVKNN